jgi:hypothetical protein
MVHALRAVYTGSLRWPGLLRRGLKWSFFIIVCVSFLWSSDYKGTCGVLRKVGCMEREEPVTDERQFVNLLVWS